MSLKGGLFSSEHFLVSIIELKGNLEKRAISLTFNTQLSDFFVWINRHDQTPTKHLVTLEQKENHNKKYI